MLSREEIVGQRITNILGDSSRSDEAINFCDFVYVVANSRCFRMPSGDPEFGELLPAAQPTRNHAPLSWPWKGWWHRRRTLWTAMVTDILVSADPDTRYPDSGVIALSSGWCVIQAAGVPHGVLPEVSIVKQLPGDEPMISIWQLTS